MLATSANEIRLWDTENSYRFIKEFPFSKTVNCFSVDVKNKHIGSIVDKNLINIIDLENESISKYNTIEAKCCCYDAYGRFLGVGNMNGSIDVYDLKAKIVVNKNYPISQSPVNCINWGYGDFISTGHLNGSIILFNSLTNQFSKPLIIQNKTAIVTSVQFSQHNKNRFASAYEDGCVAIWDTTKKEPVCAFKEHEGPCTCVIFSPMNNILMATGGLDSSIGLYDTSTKKSIKKLYTQTGVACIDLHKNGTTLAIGMVDGCVQLIDLRSKTDEAFYSFNAHDSSLRGLKFISSALNSTANASQNNSNISNTSNKTLKYDYTASHLFKKSNSMGFGGLNEQQQQTRIPFTSSNNLHGNLDQTADYHQKPGKSHTQAKYESYEIFSPDVTITKPESTQLNITGIDHNGLILQQQTNQKQQINNLTPIMNPTANQQSVTSKTIESTFQTATQAVELNSSPFKEESKADGLQASNKPKLISDPREQFENQSTKAVFSNTPVKAPVVTVSAQGSTSSNMQVAQLNETTTDLLPIQHLKDFIKDSIDDLRDEFMNENFKFKCEVFKEFIDLKREMQESFRACSVNDALVAEIKRLREENKRLRKQF